MDDIVTSDNKLCIVCNVDVGRYKCPGCSRRTCSVLCVKKHKKVYSCSGKRSKTDYISLSEYSTSTLLSDYHLLEDIGRVVDGASRDVVKKRNYQSQKRMKTMSRLQSVAHSKGINLFLAPPGLSQHRSNTSRVVYNSSKGCQEILWKVHWLFPDCDVQSTSDGMKDTELLQSLLDQYIHPIYGDPVMRHRLKKYVQQRDNVEVFMRVERTANPREVYHKLCLTDTLANNLRGKIILECPSLHVILGNSLLIDRYPLATTKKSESMPETTLQEEEKEEGSSSCAKNTVCSSTGLSLIFDSYGDDV